MSTESKDCIKTVNKHIRSDYIELAEDIRQTPEYPDLYKSRKEKFERAFVDAKEKHAMRYTPYTGHAQETTLVRLKYAAMNLKNWHNGNRRQISPFTIACFYRKFYKYEEEPDFCLMQNGGFTV